jgi:uncharacterized protein YecE (DUF72 family)
MQNPKFVSGLRGLQLPVPKYNFPTEFQQASRLTYYSSFFNSIEVNSSFYKIPMKATVARWGTEVPEQFRFTFKLFRDITHGKNLIFDNAHVEKFIQTISHSAGKKGCLLVQFPPSLKKESIHELDVLLNAISTADPDKCWNVAVEFRDKGWYNEDVFDLLDAYQCSPVIQDIPKSATPQLNLQSDFVYVRFHGPTGDYGGSYTNAFLAEYASYVKEWLDEGKTVYAYFNNTKGDAFNNLITLNNLVLN